eukprot:6191402-Pleurochrysis_carterae.AAC.2
MSFVRISDVLVQTADESTSRDVRCTHKNRRERARLAFAEEQEHVCGDTHWAWMPAAATSPSLAK